MTVLVVGATESALRGVRALAPSTLRIVTNASSQPDWILVATGEQRAHAIETQRLPPYRVIEAHGLASDLTEESARHDLRAGLDTMARIGRARPGVSRLDMAIGRFVVRRWTRPSVTGVAPTEVDAQPIGIGVAGVSARIPAGPRLDRILQQHALDRVRRFVSHAVRRD
jgi:hypothetical protein